MGDHESEPEESYDQLICERNRRQRKSGGWQAMGLDRHVFRGVERKGYRVPTPIQRKAIPVLMAGKDCLAMARTGSGKTAAFVVPMLQKLKCRSGKSGFRALLISPTRELALQTFKFVKEIGRFTGLRAAVLVGGDGLDAQFGAIHQNPDIVIGTPGRLLHVVVEMNLRLEEVEFVVFDEADRLFEMGMAEQLMEVLHRLPDARQTCLFSATLPKMLVDFAKAGLTDPVLVRLDVDSKISEKLEQTWLACRNDDRIAVYLHLLANVIDTDREQTIVFCATKHFVDLVRSITEEAGYKCTYIYSDLDTDARRLHMNAFRHGECNILVVTDVAARGVDIPLLDNVINLHFPPKSKLFVHRVGRVARAGRTGRAFSLVSPDETAYLLDLCLFLNRPMSLGSGPDDLGSVPQSVIDAQMHTIISIIDNNTNVQELRKVAVNSMKAYLKSRPVASTESIARIKHEFKQKLDVLAPSALFLSQMPVPAGDSNSNLGAKPTNACSVQQLELLAQLRNYKAKTTVFEAFAKAGSTQSAVMKDKRRVHGKYVKQAHTTANAVDDDSPTSTVRTADMPVGSLEKLDDENELQAVFTGNVQSNTSVKRKRLAPDSGLSQPKSKAAKKPVVSRKDETHFVKYQPADFFSEQGLSVDRGSFDRQARDAVVDFTADDAQTMNTNTNRKKWDRKKKKFVGEAGNTGKNKKVRTEDGRWVAAGLKSGMYDRWKKKQQLQNQMDDGDEGGDEGGAMNSRRTPAGGRRGRKWQPPVSGKGDGTGTLARRGKGGHFTKELKSTEHILKERKRKEKLIDFQKQRENQRQHRKAHTKVRGGNNTRR